MGLEREGLEGVRGRVDWVKSSALGAGCWANEPEGTGRSGDEGTLLAQTPSCGGTQGRAKQVNEHTRDRTPGRGFPRLFLLSVGRGRPRPAFLPIPQGPRPGRAERRPERGGCRGEGRTERGRPKSMGLSGELETHRQGGQETAPETRTASGQRSRFHLTPSRPTLTPPARSAGSILGDARDSRHSRPPEPPSPVHPLGTFRDPPAVRPRACGEWGGGTRACSPKYTSLSHLGHFGMAELGPARVAATRRK